MLKISYIFLYIKLTAQPNIYLYISVRKYPERDISVILHVYFKFFPKSISNRQPARNKQKLISKNKLSIGAKQLTNKE